MANGRKPAYETMPKLTVSERALVMLLRKTSAPLGARVVMRELTAIGISISEASTSRLLLRLDELGLTVPVGKKGRVLTDYGRTLAEGEYKQSTRTAELNRALDVTHVEQLIDLLRARRGLEREIVLLVCERASAQDFEALENSWCMHTEMVHSGQYRGIVANEFHKLLVKAAHSQLFEALSTVILYDALDELDPLLYLITSWGGTVEAAPDEHKMLIDALRKRDAIGAQTILDNHLTRLIQEVENFRNKDEAGLFASFLSLTTNNRSTSAE